MAYDAVALDAQGPSTWLYCAPPTICDPKRGGTRPVMTAQVAGEGNAGAICGTTLMDDDQWHHVALVRRGAEDATVTLYIDGAVEGEQVGFVGEMIPNDQTRFTVAGQPPEPLGYPGRGQHDEVAIWHRALDAEEVAALFHRGSRRLRFRVRACQQHDCSDDPPFSGPHGDSAGANFDQESWRPGDPIELSNMQGAAFQYETVFAAEEGVSSPQLHEVRVVGRRP